jgi:hypothetical protein
MRNLIFKILVLAVFSTTVLGCNNANNSSVAPSTPTNSAVASPASDVSTKTDKIKFKTEGGSDLFSLKQRADGAKLVDGKEQELARIKADKPGKFKLKNAADKTLGYVVAEKGYWKVENPEQNQELYILRKLNNGGYKLEDGAKKEVYQIKSKDNGLEIVDASNKLVYKIKIKEGKTSLRNAAEKTIFSTKSEITPIAFACFGFDVLTREQQATLAYAVNSTGGQ